MKYAPGSFSKNFAWHGTGLRKLHATIRAGFGARLQPVSRDQWRKDSGIGDPALELIPINFFLHNARGRISVDELVYQAVERPHALRFDRLGLFALHLNRIGRPPGRAVERPAMWANEFVRELLWKDDTWQRTALGDKQLDDFILDRMNAQAEVRVKCRNNYRHLFELCEYLPAPLGIINSGAEQWVSSALSLSWDRFILDGGTASRANLLDYAKDDELHKLLGMSRPYLKSLAEAHVDLYLRVGALDRFHAPPPPSTTLEIPEEAGTDWIEDEESDDVVKRRIAQAQAQVRDRKKAAALRRHYRNRCMFCGLRLLIGEKRYYSEAAHIRALGKPHNGPDKASNMVVLCPNHHLQFDSGILRLVKDGADYVIKSKIDGDPLHDQKLSLKHALDHRCVHYHFQWFSSERG